MSLMCYTFNIIPESVYGLHYHEILANTDGNKKNKFLEHFCSKNSGEWLTENLYNKLKLKILANDLILFKHKLWPGWYNRLINRSHGLLCLWLGSWSRYSSINIRVSNVHHRMSNQLGLEKTTKCCSILNGSWIHGSMPCHSRSRLAYYRNSE